MNRDPEGIIGQIQPDGSIEGGDSVCWQGHYIYLTDDMEKFPFRKTFEVGFGSYVRHPDPNRTNNGFGAYYRNPWDGCISRDQMTGILIGLIGSKDVYGVFRLALHHALRLFLFTYNTIKNGNDPKIAKRKLPDLADFSILALIIRGLGPVKWLLWPILCLLDLQLLGSIVYNRFTKSSKDDVINMVGRLLVSLEHAPTPVSILAGKTLDKPHISSRLTEYWCGWRDNCEFVPLYLVKLNQLLLKK